MKHKFDALVIGAGMAGLIAARKIAEKGFDVAVIARGLGTTNMSSGAIDILGYLPETEMVLNPKEGLRKLIETQPKHPYAALGENADDALRTLRKAVTDFLNATRRVGLKYSGELTKNLLLPNCMGTFKPTCLCQPTMTNGDLLSMENSSILFVGIDAYTDFNAKYIANSLSTILKKALKRNVIKSTRYTQLSLNAFKEGGRASAVDIARALEEDKNLDELSKKLKKARRGEELLAIPAILGYTRIEEKQRTIEDTIGCPIFENLSIPPSIPGQRLQAALEETTIKSGVKVFGGYKATRAVLEDSQCKKVEASSISAQKFDFKADVYILATGDFVSGGIMSEKERIFEPIFNLPVYMEGKDLIATELFPTRGHPLSKIGIEVNSKLQPVDKKGKIIAKNVYAAGSVLARYDYNSEKSGLGVALATGYRAGLEAIGGL